MNNFQKETGALINKDRDLLYIFDGSAGSVSFDPEVVWDLHKASAGIVYAFSHVHPVGMTEPSSIDKEMLKGWAYALHPFPIRMIVIAEEDDHFTETCYFAQVESKESWLARNKETPREFKMVFEWHNHYSLKELPPYIEILLKNSYKGNLN